ncbi:hypothetical protein HYW17_00945 [Candidatus Uhrbacteria bacterium]|nr:hypothetical protein [Candidatus Uhrbacteria bacterium]
MTNSLNKIIVAFGALMLFGAGCISISSGPAGNDGGVFKSTTFGREWAPKVTLVTSAGLKNFGGANIITFAVDPQDHRAIYAGSDLSGMFYTYDGGETWQQPQALTHGYVSAIAIDPKNKCITYAAVDNRILKSVDCNRTFSEIYREVRAENTLTAFVIDPRDSANLYAGTVRGTLLKSNDAGRTWILEHTFPGRRIVSIVIDPRASAVRYVALTGKGVWKTTDGGSTFKELSEPLKSFTRAFDVRYLISARSASGHLLLATRNSILRTVDGGEHFEALPLVSPGDVDILSIGMDLNNPDAVYYGTSTTFYISGDGGKGWSTKKLPSTRAATALIVDPEEPNNLYLGVTKIKR